MGDFFMVKVRIFDENHELDLEDEINEFICELNGSIIDIKYQVAICHDKEEMEYCFSCLILYEENE